MPELPEVETVRRGLEPALVGRVLSRVSVRRRKLRIPVPDGFEAALNNRRVTALTRRAKFLLVHLDDGNCVIAHLGMSGRFLIYAGAPPEPGPHDHVILETDAGVSVYFNDPRRFGFLDLVPAHSLDRHRFLRRLGPEPLGNAFDAVLLGERLAGRSGPVKTVLLDQSVVAGIGNIYACEALFRAGISPRRKASNVTGMRLKRLAAAIRDVLSEAIEAGGSSLRDHRQPSGELGYFQHQFAVYGKEGEPCPNCDCTRKISRVAQAGRSTFYCARRQR
ncbi:MAG: bifunctional DNA-formamidopyrimidine glycosylase/DNA-(apurinic or apyrimidinic site) lyase [Alphaproteobacteria bacterium]|nr:bifunctional DNA-formamidopyrimidine glycosylase/DNA-(apurinic or apyrimidinic site) lyase [Alphaproteobacteria bacterium]